MKKKQQTTLIIGKCLLNISLYVNSNFKYFVVKHDFSFKCKNKICMSYAVVLL